MDVLNLGAGNRIEPNAVNHDRTKHRDEIDVAWDLDRLPWPWDDEAFDRVIALSVFEHLRLDLVEVLNECWRILRPGGQLVLKLPHWQSDVSWWDPTHRWRYSERSFDQFDPDTERGKEYAFYTDRKWRIIRPAELNSAGSSIHVGLEVRK